MIKSYCRKREPMAQARSQLYQVEKANLRKYVRFFHQHIGGELKCPQIDQNSLKSIGIMCKSDDCIRLYFCIRFEFPLIFTDGILISGGMGKCHNCKNSLKCVGFMCKSDNCILCWFVLDSIFPCFLLILFRFWTDRNQVIITRRSWECVGFMCKSTILATWLFVLHLLSCILWNRHFHYCLLTCFFTTELIS